LCLVRKPGKTIILFLLIALAGVLMASMLMVRQSINHSEDLAKTSLGAYVSIGVDYNALNQALNSGYDAVVGDLTPDTMDSLGQLPMVKDYDYTLDVPLTSSEYSTYKPSYSNSSMSISVDSGGFTLCGVHNAGLLPLQEGAIKLVDGRAFSQSEMDDGSAVTLISSELAEENDLHVGDTFTLTNEILDNSATGNSLGTYIGEAPSPAPVAASHDVPLQIIGIFEANGISGSNMADGSNLASLSQLYNTAYVPVQVAINEYGYMQTANNQLYASGGDSADSTDGTSADIVGDPYYTPLFVLRSIDDIAGFTQAAQAVLPAYYTVISADSQFADIAAPMQSIKSTITAALGITIVVSLVIISLVVLFFLRDRLKEFGVYLALGVRKQAVVGQVLAEVLMVSVVALAISVAIGYLVSAQVSQQMIADQVAAQQSNIGGVGGSGVFGGPGGAGGSNGGIDGSMLGGDAGYVFSGMSYNNILADYQVVLDVPTVLIYIGFSLGVVVLSCIAPLLYILRLKPRRILA